MANIVWSGNQVSRAGTQSSTVTAVGTGTITAAINSKTETYTYVAADTLAATATAAIAAFQNSVIPEFGLVTWTNPSDGVMFATGPSDGRPVTVTFGATGSCTLAATVTVAPTSANDIADAANYVGGVAPVNLDVIVAQGTAPDMLYGLATYTGNTVSINRQASYTGSIGLSDWNPIGFQEYLPVRLETAGTAITATFGSTGKARVKTTGAAATVIARASNSQEVLELTGLAASSVVDANNCGVIVSPLVGDTSTVTTALVANNATLRTGVGGVIVTGTVKGASANLGGSVTTLTVDKQASVTMTLAAATTTLNIVGGTCNWNSTGATGTVLINSGGTLDLTTAPATVATSGITVNAGGSLKDPFKRLSGYNITGDDWTQTNLDIGTSFTIAVT